MIDLTGHLNSSHTYYDVVTDTFATFSPSAGQDAYLHERNIGKDILRMYGDYSGTRTQFMYLNDEPVIGNPASPSIYEPSERFFFTNVDTTVDPRSNETEYPTEWTMISTQSFVRPLISSQEPLVFSGWIRMHSVRSGGVPRDCSIIMCHEDGNAYYKFNLLRVDDLGVPTDARIDKRDYAGGSAGSGEIIVANAPAFTNWNFGQRYRFAIELESSAIRVYINNALISSTGDSSLRVGNVGIIANDVHIDFGDLAVTGENL